MATSEATDKGSRKRHRLFLGNCDEFSLEIKDNQVTTTDITAVTDTSSQTLIARGKPAQLEAHLSNDCVGCSDDISLYLREKVAKRDSNYIQRPKKNFEELVAQLRHFEAQWLLYNLSYVAGMDTPKLWWSSFKNQPWHLAELAYRIFSINPTQAACERNFSTLKWILEDQ
ncbi:19770_t:CDS:2 [Cetraspora pellucida]|uniref:19770_t:CDS:1 n=1 Tax=Cetraspora pellucida TaxID=1433469 RepID=A0A9N9IG16_9GLOM|nr:19770_t:CDS:2 [Cetraspora pellucida]